eukprot:1159540-Pelagomonas_calceolata.AAC.2
MVLCAIVLHLHELILAPPLLFLGELVAGACEASLCALAAAAAGPPCSGCFGCSSGHGAGSGEGMQVAGREQGWEVHMMMMTGGPHMLLLLRGQSMPTTKVSATAGRGTRHLQPHHCWCDMLKLHTLTCMLSHDINDRDS